MLSWWSLLYPDLRTGRGAEAWILAMAEPAAARGPRDAPLGPAPPLTAVAELDGRQRKTLGWETPAERLAQLLTTINRSHLS